MNNAEVIASQMSEIVKFLRQTHPGGFSDASSQLHSQMIREAISIEVRLQKKSTDLHEANNALSIIRNRCKLKKAEDFEKVQRAFKLVQDYISGSWIPEEE